MKNKHTIWIIFVLLGGLLWFVDFWNHAYLDYAERAEFVHKNDGAFIVVREMWNITNSEKSPKCRVYRKPDDVEKIKALMYLWDYTFYPGGMNPEAYCGYHYEVMKFNKNKEYQNSIEINIECDFPSLVEALTDYFPNEKDSLYLCKKDLFIGDDLIGIYEGLDKGEILLKPEEAGYLVANKRIECAKVNAGYDCWNDCKSIGGRKDSITLMLSDSGIDKESISVLADNFRKWHTLQVFVKDKKDVNKAIHVLGDTCKPFEALCIVKEENLHKAKPYYKPREW